MLIFLFNSGLKKIICKFEITAPIENARLRSCYDGKKRAVSAEIATEVNSQDVKVLVYEKRNEK